MAKFNFTFASALVALAFSAGLAQAAKLSVKTVGTGNYHCDDGQNVKALYMSLSDGSLSFVKFSHAGKNFTLPNLVSASGARYSDEFATEWFEHQGEAMLNLDVTNDANKAIICKKM